MWQRSLHNVYMQTLVEFGIVGTVALALMLIDFWKRNAALRSERFIAAWRQADPRGLDLRAISLALEAAMVAFLITGFFYDQLYVHWLYSLLIINAVLHATAQRLTNAAPAGVR
jgi:O-antigen ligase